MKLPAIAVFLAGASALSFSAPAMAQSAPEDGAETARDEIVVSARRRDESVQDVPQVVNAVSGVSLEQLNIKKFEDVAALVPGLSLNGTNTGTSSTMSLRGVTFDSFGSAPPTVAFYMNEVSVFNTFVFQSMFDIGQIEVLRGPQGTLRGRSAPSGSITLTTRRPDLEEFGGYVNASGTTLDAYNINAAVGVPIIPGKLAIRVAGLYDENKANRVRSVNSTVDPHADTQATRISLRADPVDFLSINATWQHLERGQRTTDQVESTFLSQGGTKTGTGPLINASDRLGIANVPTTLDENQDVFTVQSALRFAGQKLEYIYGRTDWETATSTPADGAYRYTTRSMRQLVATDYLAETHEVRLSSEDRVAGLFDYTVGYFRFKNKSLNLIDGDAFLDAFQLQYKQFIDFRQQRDEEAFFGNVIAHLGEKTEISAGLRHIKATDSDAALISIPAFGISNSPLLAPITRKASKTIYNVSLSHRFSDDFMVYANTGSAFRPGPATLGVTRTYTPRLTRYLNLAPESSKSYEIGFKSTLLDRKLRLNAAFFHQDFDGYLYRGAAVPYVNVQGGFEVVGNFNFQANVPAKVDGFEIELNYRHDDNFSIGASFAYAKGKITNGTIPCNDTNGDGKPDNGTATVASIKAAAGGEVLALCNVTQRLSFAPDWSVVILPEYQHPVSANVNGFVRGLFSIYPNNQNVPTNDFDSVKGYATSNLYLGVRDADDAWEVSVFAKNLFNTGRTLTRGNLQQITNGSINAAYGSYVPVSYTNPREFGVNLRYSFGSR